MPRIIFTFDFNLSILHCYVIFLCHVAVGYAMNLNEPNISFSHNLSLSLFLFLIMSIFIQNPKLKQINSMIAVDHIVFFFNWMPINHFESVVPINDSSCGEKIETRSWRLNLAWVTLFLINLSNLLDWPILFVEIFSFT